MGCPQARQFEKQVGKTLFPYLDFSTLMENERLLLEGQLIDETEKMVSLFADTEDTLIASLESQNVNVGRLRNYVGTYISKHGSKDDLERLNNSRNLYDVFFALHPIKSFFHYEVIEKIVTKFGSDEDRQLMKEYISEFDKFCERSVFEVPPNIFNEGDPKLGDEVFSVKFTPKEHASLGDVVSVRRKLANILNIEVLALRLCCITEGCICLRFLISANVEEKIFPLSQSQINALSNINVRILESYSSLEDEDLLTG